MTKTETRDPAKFIVPLYMNGMQGRMLRIPAPADKKREILFVYGHHSTIERWWGITDDISQYGAVTMPDLPGFGGMESFYKIGEKPTLDNYADYLAAFVKLRYNRKRVTIVAMSFGFVVATRMLQRYPDLARKVDMLVSAAGFTRYDDFKFSRRRLLGYRLLSKFLSFSLVVPFFRNVCLHPWVLQTMYAKTPNAKHKFADLSPEEHRKMAEFETYLWHANDVKTHWVTTHDMLTLDNCHHRVDLPVWHIRVKKDQYFDAPTVEQHMRVIFSDFHQAISKLKAHAPSVIADAATAAPLLPAKIRRVLSRD
jgi:pimeloyl-ACP methyl ester carboxylesterase